MVAVSDVYVHMRTFYKDGERRRRQLSLALLAFVYLGSILCRHGSAECVSQIKEEA